MSQSVTYELINGLFYLILGLAANVVAKKWCVSLIPWFLYTRLAGCSKHDFQQKHATNTANTKTRFRVYVTVLITASVCLL